MHTFFKSFWPVFERYSEINVSIVSYIEGFACQKTLIQNKEHLRQYYHEIPSVVSE